MSAHEFPRCARITSTSRCGEVGGGTKPGYRPRAREDKPGPRRAAAPHQLFYSAAVWTGFSRRPNSARAFAQRSEPACFQKTPTSTGRGPRNARPWLHAAGARKTREPGCSSQRSGGRLPTGPTAASASPSWRSNPPGEDAVNAPGEAREIRALPWRSRCRAGAKQSFFGALSYGKAAFQSHFQMASACFRAMSHGFAAA
jgi:hypothetical protein